MEFFLFLIALTISMHAVGMHFDLKRIADALERLNKLLAGKEGNAPKPH